MRFYLTFVSVASVVFAAIAARTISPRISQFVSARKGGDDHFLAAPPGSTILFLGVFLVGWIVISVVLVIPWLIRISDIDSS